MGLLAGAGLGIVMTSTEEVHHPDPEHGKLPPQPILLVATSDGALRLFTFASLKRSAGSITHAAHSYDVALYPARSLRLFTLSTSIHTIYISSPLTSCMLS